MCSIAEDDFGDEGGAHAMVEDPKVNGYDEEFCKKCKVEVSEIKLDFRESMCKLCFLAYVRHKFRATLGSTKIVRRNSKVLLYFPATAASVCLAHMIQFAFEQEVYKRLCFDLEVMFIDESRLDQAQHKREEITHNLQRIIEQFPNFKCYYSSLAGFTEDKPNTIQEAADHSNDAIEREQKFFDAFHLIKSLSAKQDLIAVQRKTILRNAARALDCQYVFMPDISINLATRLLTSVALGRGSSAAFDVAFCDDKMDAIKFVRPIKDLTEVEVSSYLQFNNLKCLDNRNFGDDLGQFASIQNLTSKFIGDLQRNFSSTVSTVYRTCSKVAPKVDALPVNGPVPQQFFRNLSLPDATQRCAICKSFLDYNNSETLFATEFSRFVSEAADSAESLKNIQSIEDKANSSVNGSNSIRKHLCHGCRNMFDGLDDDLEIFS